MTDQTKASNTLRKRFTELLEEWGNIAELSRQSGLNRRTFEYKRDGTNPVTPWDVAALERLLQIKQGAVVIQVQSDAPDWARDVVHAARDAGGKAVYSSDMGCAIVWADAPPAVPGTAAEPVMPGRWHVRRAD